MPQGANPDGDKSLKRTKFKRHVIYKGLKDSMVQHALLRNARDTVEEEEINRSKKGRRKRITETSLSEKIEQRSNTSKSESVQKGTDLMKSFLGNTTYWKNYMR